MQITSFKINSLEIQITSFSMIKSEANTLHLCEAVWKCSKIRSKINFKKTLLSPHCMLWECVFECKWRNVAKYATKTRRTLVWKLKHENRDMQPVFGNKFRNEFLWGFLEQLSSWACCPNCNLCTTCECEQWVSSDRVNTAQFGTKF